MRGPGYNMGYASPSRYVTGDGAADKWQINLFGNRLVESMVFPKDMSAITMYFDHLPLSIKGIRIHSATNSQFFGQETGWVKYFAIHGPAEVVNEIRVMQAKVGLYVSFVHDEGYPAPVQLVPSANVLIDEDQLGPRMFVCSLKHAGSARTTS